MKLNFIKFSQVDLDENFFKEILEKIEKKEPLLKEKKDFSLNVVLVGRNRIRYLNKRFRGKNKVTTVLSFPEKEIKKPTKKELQFIEPPKEEKLLGEIILCPARIKKLARREKQDFKKMLCFYFLHGLLHLLGYDHQKEEDAQKMEKKEKELMQILGYEI